MEAVSKIRLKDSITMQLLAIVFSIYVLVTIVLTLSHIIANYFDTKEIIMQDMAASQNTFTLELSRAIRTGNQQQLQLLVEGIQRIPIIIGVRVQGDLLGEITAGIVGVEAPLPDTDTREETIIQESPLSFSGTFSYTAPLYYSIPEK